MRVLPILKGVEVLLECQSPVWLELTKIDTPVQDYVSISNCTTHVIASIPIEVAGLIVKPCSVERPAKVRQSTKHFSLSEMFLHLSEILIFLSL